MRAKLLPQAETEQLRLCHDARMPSDASMNLWQSELDTLE